MSTEQEIPSVTEGQAFLKKVWTTSEQMKWPPILKGAVLTEGMFFTVPALKIVPPTQPKPVESGRKEGE